MQYWVFCLGKNNLTVIITSFLKTYLFIYLWFKHVTVKIFNTILPSPILSTVLLGDNVSICFLLEKNIIKLFYLCKIKY